MPVPEPDAEQIPPFDDDITGTYADDDTQDPGADDQ